MSCYVSKDMQGVRYSFQQKGNLFSQVIKMFRNGQPFLKENLSSEWSNQAGEIVPTTIQCTQ